MPTDTNKPTPTMRNNLAPELAIAEHERTDDQTGRRVRVFVPHWTPRTVCGPICEGSLTFARWEAWADDPAECAQQRANAADSALDALRVIFARTLQTLSLS